MSGPRAAAASRLGGITGNSRLFRGDIVETAIYRSALDAGTIRARMFTDQPTNASQLVGYYKLGYSANTNNFYRNFAAVPPGGTDPAVRQGGAIEFEETDQAGEQSSFDSRKNRGADALTPLSGAFSWSQTALSRPVPGIAFDFRLGYSSAIPTAPPGDGGIDPYGGRSLGPGWRHSFDIRLFTETSLTEFKLLTWEGSIETWVRTNTLYRTRHREYRGELVQLPDLSFEWTTPERLVYRFQDPTDNTVMAGRLREIRDFNGNAVQLLWNEDDAYITNILDTANGRYEFNYNTALGLLTNLTFGPWKVNLAYDNTNRLVSKSITNTSGLYNNINTTWQFSYNASNGLLQAIVDPRGNTNQFVQYDKYGRKTNEIDALGRAMQTRYGVPGKRQITQIDPGTNSWVETYDRKGRILTNRDPLLNITSFTYDTNGNRTSITEPLGWTTFFGYDSRANVIARTNALGEVTRWNFHPFFNKATSEINHLRWTNRYVIEDTTGNLLRHSDDLGTLVSYTYATNGLVLASTDANGNTNRFGHDANGFLISKTDAAGFTTSYTVNEVGWKLIEENTLDDATFHSFDLNGNVVETEDTLGRIFPRTYDANGNITSTYDAKSRFTTNAYDAANQRISTTDRSGTNASTFTYTSRGKLERAINPLGNSITNFYDAANRLLKTSDPLGGTVQQEYDANGNQTAMIDKGGQRWTKTFDRLNRVIAESDPLGNTRRTTFDSAGRVKEIRTPNGHPSTHEYDGRGRLTKWTDAENFPWLYAYDGNANITNITDALGGHYVMGYSNRNERVFELNQDTNIWRYTYDELLRLRVQQDPNGTTRTVEYDPAGRVLFVDFNTGRRNSFTYDDNNNLRTVTRRISGVTTTTRFVYDLLDRVVEQTDEFQQMLRYSYDALSRVSTLTYPDGKPLRHQYDALGRLTSQLDWAGRRMTYAYDQADRLISRTYPNGIVQSNAFDTAGRITALSYSALNSQPSSLNLALTYAYDRNGNKTGGTEKGTLNWSLPPLTDELASYTAAGKLKTRTIHTNAPGSIPSPGGEGQGEGGSIFTYSYDSSGNMTNAVNGPQSYALTYDEDNRTTGIHYTSASTNVTIANRYDALGRRLSKTVNGVESRYVLNLSGSMERILCDVTGAGVITAWYVHGSDLCYRVDATNGLTCYHADAQANIIALTDGGTNLVAQYAYTPYGRLLGSSVISNAPSQIPNPYLFVGSQGVMEELPGLYFMRARYYSAEAGVFLSTDPVKKIGPGWKPIVYVYADSNPLFAFDPKGETPLHLAAFVAGMKVGLVEGVFEGAIESQLSQLPVSLGVPEGAAENITEASFEYLSAGKTAIKTYTYTKAVVAGGDPSRLVAAYILGEIVGGKAGKSAYSLAHKIREGYDSAIFKTGSALGGVLYNNFGVGALPPLNLPSATANNTMSARTVSAANVAPAANSGSTRPSGSSNSGGGSGSSGGSTTLNGGGASIYTVRAGDTLGNIGYARGTTAREIGAANGIQNLDRIQVGQRLIIPTR